MRLVRLFLLAGLWASVSCSAGAQAASNTKRVETAMEHKYVTVNGVKLHYVTQGKGQVILFLHGFPEFWYEWKNQIAEFGKDYQAVAPDMRGYNLSDRPPKVEDYTIPPLIEDIHAFLSKISEGKKAILVAHDWGGALAWIYAAKYPETLDKLIIINAPHPTIFARELANNPKQQQASSYMTFFQSADAEKTLSANNYGSLAGIVFGSLPASAFSEEDKQAYIAAWSQPGGLTGGRNYYRANHLAPPTKRANDPIAIPRPSRVLGFASEALPAITIPTLVIWGEKDVALLTGNLDGLDKMVKTLTIKRVPTAGHWIVHEEPETVNKAIREFVAAR